MWWWRGWFFLWFESCREHHVSLAPHALTGFCLASPRETHILSRDVFFRPIRECWRYGKYGNLVYSSKGGLTMAVPIIDHANVRAKGQITLPKDIRSQVDR